LPQRRAQADIRDGKKIIIIIIIISFNAAAGRASPDSAGRPFASRPCRADRDNSSAPFKAISPGKTVPRRGLTAHTAYTRAHTRTINTIRVYVFARNVGRVFLGTPFRIFGRFFPPGRSEYERFVFFPPKAKFEQTIRVFDIRGKQSD